jgi:hypothetical protein
VDNLAFSIKCLIKLARIPAILYSIVQTFGISRAIVTSGRNLIREEEEVKLVQSNVKTDEQLESILHDTADWVVTGHGGQVLCFAASLRRAVDRAAILAADGAVIANLSRLPFDNIVVGADQMRRLRNAIAGREVEPIKFSDNWVDDLEIGLRGP